MTIASALDKLNDKLAGSDQPGAQTIEGMILRIIDNIDAGGGGSIPVASADTLGGIKVGNNLSITEDGVLSASGGGGGGGGLVVHVVVDEVQMEVHLDKTYAEIEAASSTGLVILYNYWEDDGFAEISYLGTIGSDGEGGYMVKFSNNGDITEYTAATKSDYPQAK